MGIVFCNLMARQLPVWATKFAEKRRDAGITQTDLALDTDVSPSTISQIERGIQNPAEIGFGRLLRILNRLGWSPRQFVEDTGLELSWITGEEPRNASESHAPSKPSANLKPFKLHPVRALATAGQPIGGFMIPIATELERPNMIIVQVEGDSMESEPDGYRHGDIVLVDTALTRPQHDHRYVVLIAGDGYVIKRFWQYPDRSTALISDNPRYPAIRPDEAQIIGECYKAMRIF